MPQIKIGNREVGDGAKVFVIAEACENHLGRMDWAKEMVVKSKLAGADAVKFQHHIPEEEMLPDVPMSSNFNMPLFEFLKKHSLTMDQHRELKRFCDEVGILYMCTPFCWKAAQEISTLGLEAYKIGSGEMTDIPSLVKIASLGKPMIVSTGMCEFPEIERTYNALINRGTPLALTNCLSEYPPVYEDLNLGVIPKMKERFPKAVIGHSDHTPDLYTCFAAVALGARIIEKHVILDKRVVCPDQSVSIDFRELAELVDGVRKVEVGLGSEKRVNAREKPIREWAFRSLVAMKDIPEGQTITDEMVWSKRPGTGIPSYRMDEVIGKKARRKIAYNSLLAWEDFV